MKKRKSIKAIAMALATSLMFTGCTYDDETYEEEETIEVETPDDETLKEISTPKDFEKYYEDLSEYGVYDETNIVGITINNPLDGEAKDYIFRRIATYPMSSEEYGDVEDFKEQAKDVINGLLTDEMVDNSDILLVVNVYDSPLDSDGELNELRIMYEYEVAGVRKSITIIENQFTSERDNIYIINRNINIMGEILDVGVFMQGDTAETDLYDKPLIETFEIPRGIYTVEDLTLLLAKRRVEQEKQLSLENNE